MHNFSKLFLRRIGFLSSNLKCYQGFNRCVFQNIVQSGYCGTYNLFVNAPKIRFFANQNVLPAPVTKRKTGISNIDDLKLYISYGKQFYLKQLTNILDSLKFENISNEDAELLLECCGQSVTDSAKQIRNEVCQKIYEKLLEHNKLNLNIYHIYIRVCTENGILLNSTEFLRSVKSEPNQNTYKLLLDNVCETGDIEQAYDLLKVMKNIGISADEEIFNKLALGSTVNNGLEAGESVLLTMKTARIPESTQTKFSIIKGVAKRKCYEDFKNVLLKYEIDLTERHILELVEILCLNGNVAWLPKIKKLSNVPISREFLYDLKKVCVHLVHMGESESAMIIYKEFVDASLDQNYAFFLLKEMLHCNVDIEMIITMAKHLHDENLNKYALQNLTEIAIKHNYTGQSWKLLENLDERRSHFFWPLLINANQREGEKGVFDVLKKMISMDVKVDSDTLQFYVLPFYDPGDFKFLVKDLFNLGLRVTEIISPMLMVLLKNNNLEQATDLCNEYDVPISGDNFLNLLSSTWTATKDIKSVVLLLQRYCEANSKATDLVGEFLIKTLNNCKATADFTHYHRLMKLVHERRLRIDSTSATILHNVCSMTCKSFDTAEKIRDLIDVLINFELKPETSHIPHPKNMKIDELECHLLELLEKGMETRGILRKLIQAHSNFGNLLRVKELRQQFLNAGYEETIGMKSSLMHGYVKGGHLEAALNVYKEIKSADAAFRLDSFKIIDLATLLIKENRFSEAMDMIQEETKKSNTVLGGQSIERNCWELLKTFKNGDQQRQMFDFLIEKGYCKPTNVILGPLVRIHLSRGDLQKAVDVYIECTNKYKHTPLQFEIICAVLKSEDEVLLQDVLKVTENIHGAVPTQEALIAALAENGQENILTKLLANNKILCKREIKKRCERWTKEGKVEALQTLAKVCQRLREEVVDMNFVYSCIMHIFSLNGDVKGATQFYENLVEKDIIISKDLEAKLNKMTEKSGEVTNKSAQC